MNLPLYQVDAFASELFSGNPAAVCPLTEWLSDELMQSIAAENNLSETAFFVPVADRFQLRWFTPKAEVKLCGHATLATAHVLFNHLFQDSKGVPKSVTDRGELRFETQSGELVVSKKGSELELNFPAQHTKPCPCPETLAQALGAEPLECEVFEDLLVKLVNEAEVASLRPDFKALAQLNYRGIIATACGSSDEVDFVSRFFAPAVGIDEDPVTGSSHTRLAPFWAKRLGKNTMKARQLSERGGSLSLELSGERVLISGRAHTYLVGSISV